MASDVASGVAGGVAGELAARPWPVELAAATPPASTAANKPDLDLTVEVPTASPTFSLAAASASPAGQVPMASQTGRTGRVGQATIAAVVVVVLPLTGVLGATQPVALAEAPSHQITTAATAHQAPARPWPGPVTRRGGAGALAPSQGPAGPAGGDGNQLFTVLNNIIRWGQSLLVLLATAAFVAGGLRYLWAFGDPSEIDAAKRTVKAAVIGFGIAALASGLAAILSSIFGVG